MSLITTMKNVIDVRKEIERRKSQTQRILEALKGDREVTTITLNRIAFDYTARVSELRKEGHVIVAEYVKPGLFRYHYKGQRQDV